MFPAAFAPAATGDVLEVSSKTLPLLSVGALNPDGSTALFSNGGDWVLAFEVGAALVSTFPVTFNGGAQPSVRVETYTGRPRSTIDPDSFASGFGTWSGTSFSAPVLAARLAHRLGLALGSSTSDSSAESCVARLWDAITAETGFRSAS
jgi:subtilisin family serine protease